VTADWLEAISLDEAIGQARAEHPNLACEIWVGAERLRTVQPELAGT